MDPMVEAFARDMLSMTEEDMAKITPEKEQEYKNAMENMANYRIVAEVVSSKYCTAMLEVGQKFVLNGVQIDQDASDCPLCVGAISPLHALVSVYLDRCFKGRDIAGPVSGFACTDPGIEVGGLGSVLFEARIEPV